MLDLAPVELYILGFGGVVQLSHEPYLVSGGGEVRPEWRVNRHNMLIGSFRATYQDFSELTETFDQRFRGGPEFRWAASWRHIVSTRSRFVVGGAFARKLARRRFHQYYAYSAWVSHALYFSNGAVLTNSFAYTRTQHDSPNRIESLKTRHQDYLTTGATLAVPISALVSRLRPVKLFRNTTISTSVEYERGLSNVTNYTFSNWRFTVGFTKAFDF